MLEFAFKIKETGVFGTTLRKWLTEPSNDDPIDSTGGCTSCSQHPNDDEIVDCVMCAGTFHTACLSNPLSTKFLQDLRANPCTWWFCASCSKDAEAAGKAAADENNNDLSRSTAVPVDINTIITDTVAAVLDSFMNDMMTKIDEKLSAITKPVAEKPLDDEQEQSEVVLYSSVASANLVQKPTTRQVVTIDALPNISAGESAEEIRRTVADSLKSVAVPTNFVKANSKRGSVAISFPNDEAKKAGMEQINNLKFTSKETKKMLPKLVITGDFTDVFETVPESLPVAENRKLLKEAFRDSIVMKNHNLKPLLDAGHTLDVVYIKSPLGDGKTTVVIKVSPLVRLTIMEKQQRAIFIGCMSYRAQDRHYVRQCFHCQQIGHISSECERIKDANVCFYCMGKHRSTECGTKKNTSEHACAKCYSSPIPAEKREYRTHNSASENCPVLQREVKRVAANTDYFSKNVM